MHSYYLLFVFYLHRKTSSTASETVVVMPTPIFDKGYSKSCNNGCIIYIYVCIPQ